MHRIVILSVLLMQALLVTAADAQAGRRFALERIDSSDPRAQLATDFATTLLTLDSAAVANFVLQRAAPSANRDSLLEQTALLLGSVRVMGSGAIGSVAATMDQEPQVVSVVIGTGPGPALAATLSISGQPYRIERVGRAMAPPPPPAAPSFTTFDELDQVLRRRAQENGFSGVVLVARGGNILFHHGYGLADRERGHAIDTATRFNLGSGNKQFAAVSILRLAQEGRVELDAPVGRYVKGLAPATAQHVTLRHLLQHRSGLGDHLRNEEFNRDRQRQWTTSELLALFRAEPPAFTPGTQRAYSNDGYVLLGAVIEAVTGRSYADVLREWVYEPARMNRTGPTGPGEVPNTAIGYAEQGGVTSSNEPFRPRPSAAGGHYSTAGDLFRFLQAMKENRLLQPRYTEIFFNEFENERQPGSARGFSMGGGLGGISVSVRANVDNGETAIVMTNRNPPTAETYTNAIVARLFGS